MIPSSFVKPGVKPGGNPIALAFQLEVFSEEEWGVVLPEKGPSSRPQLS
jgi:hypothetical protein